MMKRGMGVAMGDGFVPVAPTGDEHVSSLNVVGTLIWKVVAVGIHWTGSAITGLLVAVSAFPSRNRLEER